MKKIGQSQLLLSLLATIEDKVIPRNPRAIGVDRR